MWDQLGDHLPYDDLKLNLDRARRWHPLNRSLYLGARVMLPGLVARLQGRPRGHEFVGRDALSVSR